MNRATYLLAFLIGVCFATTGFTIVSTLELDASLSPVTITPRPEFGTYPPDCGHLYDVNKHREWASCIGVGHVISKQMKRNDI